MRTCVASPRKPGSSDRQAGMALILALMALMVVTVIGLTLAATTSTEVQVAANYRWSRQALYNAETGLSVAKVELGKTLGAAQDFTALLPPRTGQWWVVGGTPAKAALPVAAVGTRNYENYQCDRRGNGMGNGLIVPTPALPSNALENVTAWPPGAPIAVNGTFTVWMRRAQWYAQPSSGVAGDTDHLGELRDRIASDGGDPYPTRDAMILLAEGVAPAANTAGTRAVQYLEVSAFPGGPQFQNQKHCGPLGPQTGMGPGNHNLYCPGGGIEGSAIGGQKPPGVP